MTTGLYAGSFDPLHRGHLAVIETAARACDELVVVAAGNPDKRHGVLFTLPERRALIAASTRHLANVVAMEHHGLIAELATWLEVDFLVRGFGKERLIELEMAAANQLVCGVPTLFFPPDDSTSWISSREVRARFAHDGADAVAPMVPDAVVVALRSKLSDVQPAITP